MGTLRLFSNVSLGLAAVLTTASLLIGCSSASLKNPKLVTRQTECIDGGKVVGSLPPFGNELYCQILDLEGLPLKHGPYTQFYSFSGKAFQTGHYLRGKKSGLWRGWHENGNLMEEAEWKEGEHDGQWTLWLENGTKKFEGKYVNGKLNGLAREWNDNGTPAKVIPYANGQKQGLGVIYDDQGRLRARAQFKADLKEGIEELYSPEGKVQRRTRYEAGRSVADLSHSLTQPLSDAPQIK